MNWQNVNSYLRAEREKGVRLEGVNSFATLLKEINKIEGIERIRFVSPHPKDFTDDVIEAIADCEKVCKLIHLPLQSGSSKVLKTMNRKYTKEHYLELVDKIRTAVPDIAITTDIIVGFPGETEEEFEEMIKNVDADLIFCGHTHVPAGYQTNTKQTVVNVGSVGRPMTKDAKACYCIADFENGSFSIEHRLIDYNRELSAEIMRTRNFDGAEKLAEMILHPTSRHI